MAKTVRAIALAAVMTWRASLLKLLAGQDARAREQAEALARPPGPRKRGRPKKIVPEEPASTPIVGFVGLTFRYEIPAPYWKLALVARMFQVESLFALRQAIDVAADGRAWLEWLGVQDAGQLLDLPPLTLAGKRFVDGVVDRVCQVLARGTKAIARRDVKRCVARFYALGRVSDKPVCPAQSLRQRYERDVKEQGMDVGEFLQAVLESRDGLVSADGGHWQPEPTLTPYLRKEYKRLLGKKNSVDEELTQILDHVPFAFVAALLRERYYERGRRPYHPVLMWKIVFVGWYRGITSPTRLEQEIQNNMAYKKFLGLAVHADVPDRTTIYRFIVHKLMPHIDELFYTLVHRCQEADLLSGRLCGDGFSVVGQERKKSDAPVRNLGDLRVWVQKFVFEQLKAEGRTDLTEQDVDCLLRAAEQLDYTGLESQQRQLKQSIQTLLAELVEDSGVDLGQVLARRDEACGEEQVRGDGAELSEFERDLVEQLGAYLREHYKEGYSLSVYHDPEGGSRRKYQIITHGYGVQLLVDAKTRCIVDVRVFPNNERFCKHFAEQVLGVQARYEYGKIVLSTDSEFTRSCVIHALGEAEEVEQYGPLATRQNRYKKQGLFGPEDFALEEHEGKRYLRCPGGALLSRYQGPHDEGGTLLETFKAPRASCEACEFSVQCRGGKGPRTVKRDVYIQEVQAHAAKMQQPHAREIMGVHRAAAEGAVGEMKHHRLLDRARQQGLARLLYQAYLCAIICNTKRLVRALEAQRTASKTA